MGPVELATVSFGQSFQITPIQLITTVASLVNGGCRVTPHFGVRAVSADGTQVQEFSWKEKGQILSEKTSETLRYVLEQVVAEGSGKKASVEGFLGFAPANDPQVIALITIDEPQGIYYGGTIAAPVIADLFQNILPYLGVEKDSVSAGQ